MIVTAADNVIVGPDSYNPICGIGDRMYLTGRSSASSFNGRMQEVLEEAQMLPLHLHPRLVLPALGANDKDITRGTLRIRGESV